MFKKYLLEIEETQCSVYSLDIHLLKMLIVLEDPLRIVIGAIMGVMD